MPGSGITRSVTTTSTTPRSYEPVTFDELRALAYSENLTRMAIETRKDQIEKLEWEGRGEPRTQCLPLGSRGLSMSEPCPDRQTGLSGPPDPANAATDGARRDQNFELERLGQQ